jgi:hypothetical protein
MHGLLVSIPVTKRKTLKKKKEKEKQNLRKQEMVVYFCRHKNSLRTNIIDLSSSGPMLWE